MEVVEDTLYLQLHKLSATKSEEALDQLLSTLWKTRKPVSARSPTSSLSSIYNHFPSSIPFWHAFVRLSENGYMKTSLLTTFSSSFHPICPSICRAFWCCCSKSISLNGRRK
ncbi:hypothetical protein M0R45_006885 [Rubus argutus]|uniref:Uncharacterized protein n=1 Tax=Rubus argutus TaxID=59490 RepID=A0AAW1YS25_RUBAR